MSTTRHHTRPVVEPSSVRPDVRRLILVRGGPGSGRTTYLARRAADDFSAVTLPVVGRGTAGARPPALLEALWTSDLATHPATDALERYLRADADRTTAGRDLVRELRRLPLPRPVVLTVDDPALVDRTTLQLLPLVMAGVTGRITVVAAVDPEAEADPDWVRCRTELSARADEVERVRLAPLGVDDADDVRRHLGLDLDAGRLARVLVETGGNPALVALAFAAPGDRDGVVRRFVGTDARTVAVATGLAFLDRVSPLRTDLVGLLAGLDPTETAARIDHLVGRGVLVDVDGELRIQAPLITEALVGGIGPAQRVRWHRLSVAWLRRLPASRRRDCELARHLLHIAEPGDAEALGTLARAGDHLLDAAPHTASTYYRRAVELAGDDSAESQRLRLRLARALLLDGRVKEAQDAAATALPRLTEPIERARATRIISEAGGTLGESVAGLLDGVESHTVHRRALAAHVAARSGDLPAAAGSVEAVDRELRSYGYAGRVVAAIHLAHAQGLLARYDEMLRTIDGLQAALHDETLPVQIAARTNLGFLLAMHGDRRAAGDIARAQDLLDGSRLGFMRLELESAQLVDEYHAGRWDEALGRINRIRPDVVDAGSVTGLVLMHAIECGIMVHRGQWVKARHVPVHPHDDPSTRAVTAWSQSAIDLQSGNAARALDCLDASLRQPVPPRFRDLLLLRAAEAESVAGQPHRAVARARLVLDSGSVGYRSLTAIDAQRLIGSMTGDVVALGEAHQAALGREAAFLQATTQFALGAVAGGDPAQLREAYERFHALGVDSWRRQCANELRRRGEKVPRHRGPRPTNLTDVEIQVARLVQLGRQNREIAASLSLSVKTVEAYLTRIYAKLGCSSRLELARRLDLEAATGPGDPRP